MVGCRWERKKTSKQWRFSAWWWWRRWKKERKKNKGKKKRCPFSFLNTLPAVHWQFLLLPPVKYKTRCFSNISSNYVHVPIVVLTDCVHVIILLNSINQLGSVIGTQHVYCKVRTAFLYTQINFRFQKGQLNRYRDIFGPVSPSVLNNSAIPTKYTQTLHTGTHLFPYSSSSINKMEFLKFLNINTKLVVLTCIVVIVLFTCVLPVL